MTQPAAPAPAAKARPPATDRVRHVPGPPAAPLAAGRARLAGEFALLFLGAPLALAFLLPASAIWWAIPGGLLVALALLAATPGFRWGELLEGPWLARPGVTLAFAATVLAGAAALVWATAPWALFGLPLRRPELWLWVMILYPLLSAWPQEVMFRALFFRRYGALFPDARLAVAVNAAVFGLAHLFLWNAVAVAASALGGALFALAYLHTGRGRNLGLATLLHALAGMALFTAGAGTFFYHGALP